jgi:hypothetical protein
MMVVESKFYPYLLMSTRGNTHTEPELRAMLEATAAVGRTALRNGTKHVSVAIGGANMSASERKTLARLMEDFPKELLDLILGSYVIIDSPILRGALTALRWLSPKLVMIEAVSSVPAAMAAAAAALEKHGIAVDAGRVDGARRWLQKEQERQEHASAAGP